MCRCPTVHETKGIQTKGVEEERWCRVLSQMEFAHFKAFGFIVFRGLLTEAEVGRLTDEITTAMADAYGDTYLDDSSDFADHPAFDLPMMSLRTPFAAGLVADDPRFWQASHYLMSGATVPTQGEATCFRYNTKWHIDMPPGIDGVKFLIYPGPCSASSGQLQVIPGSHLPGVHDTYLDYVGQGPERQGWLADLDDWPIPAYGIDTQPGDVIAFHSNLIHSSVGGDRRLLWDIYYFSDPATRGREQRELIRDAILHIGDYGDMPFDRDKWPVWRDWAAAAAQSGAASTALSRLKRLGVMSTPGADLGKPKWEPRLGKLSAALSTGSAPTRRAAPSAMPG
jgi:hypothetical protein